MLDLCPIPACLARVGDGEILAANKRCLEYLTCRTPNGSPARPNRLDLWTSEMNPTDFREHIKKEGQARELEAVCRIGSNGTVSNVRASLVTVDSDDAPCFIAFLQPGSGDNPMVAKSLEAARDAALESARLKSEFLANISHEIRTPLNGIIGMTCLLRDTKLGSLQRNFTDTIRLSADNLLHLINEILDFSKLEAGKLLIEHSPFNLLSVIENTLDLLAERAHSKRLELTYLVQPDVPQNLMGDPNRLRQVLTNLVSNAIKFTDQGEVSLEVTREPADDGTAAIRFEVVDTGIGIAEDSLPQLFEMFHQADSSTSRRYGGTGLGLAICRQLVEIMRGTIGAASSPGLGSRFWFRIPFENDPGVARQPAVTVPTRLQGARILMLESNATTARHFLTVFQSLQLDIVHVSRGQDALAALREASRENRQFALAVIDMDTPGMDGLTLTRAIKADQSISATRVLILTTLTHHVETSILAAANIGACLTKPIKQSRWADYLLATLSDQPLPRLLPESSANEPDLIESLGVPLSNTPLRIIIAEDNSINQKVARGLLMRFGHASEIVDNGKKLLRALDLAPYDMIFMDCQLPELDGLQATREIRKRESTSRLGRKTYIIAMTADAVPGARERCIEAGMDDYLSKPIRVDELHAVLRRAIEFINLSAIRKDLRQMPGFIDPSVMETLRLLRIPGQPDPLPNLIDEFINSAQHHLDEIQTAIMDQETGTIERCAHSLRGSAAGIGALRLAALAADLEDGVRHGAINRAAEMLSQLEEEFASVRRSLEFESER